MSDGDERSKSGYWLLLAAALLWSLSGLFAKNDWIERIPVESRGPLLACYRALFAAGCLAPFVRWRTVRLRISMAPMVVSYAVMNVLYVTALTRTTAAAAIFLQYTAAAWAAALGWVLLRERVGRADLFALVFAVGGIACIVASESGREHLTGNVIGLGSGLTYACVIIGLRALRNEDAFWLVMLNNLVAGVVLLPWVVTMDVSLDAAQWGIVAAFGVLQLGVPYVLFAKALRTVPAHEATLIVILEAVLNPIWVLILVGERASIATWLGGGLIVTGLVLRYTVFVRRQPRRSYNKVLEKPGQEAPPARKAKP